MSYILDALRRADEERQLRGARVPGLETRHHPARRPRSRRWAWFGGLLLLGNALLALALWERGSSPTAALAAASVSPAQPRPATGAQTPAVAGEAVTPAAATQPPPAASPPRPEVGPQPPASPPAAAAAPRPGSSAPPLPSGPAAVSPGPARALPPDPVQPPPLQPPAAAPRPAASAGARVTSPASSTPSPPPAPPPPAADAPLWNDLPLAQRRALPHPRLDVHVFAERQERRFVMIEMTRYREGDTLPDGAAVEAITAEGVVLVHQGQRYLLPRR